MGSSTTSLLDRAGLDRKAARRRLARGLEGADDGELYLEYAPSPPFASGTPASAPTEVLSAYMEASAAMLERRATAVEQAAAALASDVN